MSRQRKAPIAIREEAAELVEQAATQRSADGDPEGADVMRDLANDIRKITLTEPRG